MNIVLVNPPQNSRYPQPPVGLALIAALLEREGHKVKIIDANALKLSPKAVALLGCRADAVGITAMTPTLNAAVSIANSLRHANPHLTIILGGAHATLLPERTLTDIPEVDIVVRGEGEETAIKLFFALENKLPLADIPGIGYRDDGEIILTPEKPLLTDLDSLPFLPYHMLPLKNYRPHPPYGKSMPFAGIITSRGCPYRCAFCSKPIFGSKFRAQSQQRIIEELTYYKEKFGIQEVAFYDDTFTIDRKKAHALANGILEKNLGIAWTCGTRVNLVDKELLMQLKRAGCYMISYGIESGEEAILRTLKKDVTLEQVEEAVAITHEIGIYTIGYFMIGSPGDTPESIDKTIKFAKSLKLDFAQFAITMPFPGTELYQLYMEDRKVDPHWEDFVYAAPTNRLMPVFETGLLSRDDLQHWVSRAYRQFYLRPSYLWQRIRHTVSLGDLNTNIRGLFMFLDTIAPHWSRQARTSPSRLRKE